MNQSSEIPAVSLELPNKKNGNFMMPGVWYNSNNGGISGTEMYSDVSAHRNYQNQTLNNMFDWRQQCKSGSVGIDGSCCCPNTPSSAPFQPASGGFQNQKPTINDMSNTMPPVNQRSTVSAQPVPMSDAGRIRIERQMPPNWLNSSGSIMNPTMM